MVDLLREHLVDIDVNDSLIFEKIITWSWSICSAKLQKSQYITTLQKVFQ